MEKLNSMEIARLAGVSRSTVSRVVNGYANVPEKTRERVMKVITEKEYYPLLSGQLLMGKKTGTLGFFWICDGAIGTIANDVQCSAFFVHVTESAAKLGYLVLTRILENLDDKENIDWVKRIFMQGRIDAGIFIGVDNNEPLIDELISQGKIVGVFDYFHPEHNEPNRVSVNFEENTGEKVIDYVCGLGHTKIAVIDGDMNRFSCLKRHESFIRGMVLNNISIRREWMRYGGLDESSGYDAAKQLLAECGQDYPTVICANNDATAFGVYKALEEAQIKIPDQISVIGIDGHAGGNMISPALTSFVFDFNKLFFSLVERTIGTVEQREGVSPTEFMPSTLVERGSCKRINK